MKETRKTGPKRLRYKPRDKQQTYPSRWDKSPGHYTPNIKRAEKLAPKVEDYTQ